MDGRGERVKISCFSDDVERHQWNYRQQWL